MIPILLGAAPALAAILILIAVARRERIAAVGRQNCATFEERFPPISDAEFLARCKPGIDPVVALKVRKLVASHFDIEYERVHPTTSFIEDLGAD